jgi:hypothetical protein
MEIPRINTLYSIIATITLTCSATCGFNQTNYTTTAAGDYDQCGKWSLTCPPDPIPLGDTVFISHVMDMTDDINIEGVLVVNSAGEINGAEKIKVKLTGTLINNGIINTTDELHNDGSVYNNGSMRLKKYHDDGYTCNTGTIELDHGEKYDCHGCTLECGGVLIACEFKMHENGSTIPSLSDMELCCDDGSTPSFDIAEGTIDSSTVSICSVILPVSLVNFNLESMSSAVRISWTTASEQNNDYFIVFRSTDGIDYKEIDRIKGAGNSSTLREYMIYDHSQTPGINYYYLAQVDFDGNQESFSPRSILIRSAENIQIFPNPASEVVSISLNLNKNAEISIDFYDITGRRMIRKNEHIPEEGSKFTYATNSLSKGTYLVRVSTPGEVIMWKKLIIENR